MASGRGIYQRGVEHLGERYVHVLVPKDDGSYHGPWDCSEFVSWCVYQESGILYGCDNDRGHPVSAKAYTGYWHRDAEKLGRKISWQDAAGITGAVVLRYPPAGGMGHIVISDGKGGTVEAKGTQYGVVKDRLSGRRWDTGILISGIEYESAVPAPIGAPPVVYHAGATGMDTRVVEEIQRKLLEAKANPGPIDGIYGTRTAAAVVLFQNDHGLVADGEVGPQTAEKLGIQLSYPPTATPVSGVAGTNSSPATTANGSPSQQPISSPAGPIALLRSRLFSVESALIAVAAGQLAIRRSIPAGLVPGTTAIQEALTRLAAKTRGFNLTLAARDQGYYGPKTEAAVRAFQLQKALNVEPGVVEHQTLLVLDQEMMALESPSPAGQVNPPVPAQPMPPTTGTAPAIQDRSLIITLRERYKDSHQNIDLFQLPGKAAYFFRANMAIDVDGSPKAYFPHDAKPALDKVANADVQGSSTTYIQGKVNPHTGITGQGPHEGYYVSATSLRYNGEVHKTTNFLDAEEIPYIVLPKSFPSARLGDLAYVIDLRTLEATHAIWGDCGPRGICGEASIRVARNLRLHQLDAQNGEDENYFVYVVFPGTRFDPDAEPPHWTDERIKEEASRHFAAWGGLDLVTALYEKVT